MKRKKEKDETENFENQPLETNSEAETPNASDDNLNAGNDAGTYEFDKTFGETEKQKVDEPLDVDAILSEYAPKAKRGRKAKMPEQDEIPLLIPGELLIHASDNIMVGGIGWLDSFLSKNPVDVQLLALREEQKTQLIPAANAASREISKYITANPILTFVGMMSAMYVSNYLIIRALMMQQVKAEKNNNGQN